MRLFASLIVALGFVPAAFAQSSIAEFQNPACNANASQSPPANWTVGGTGDLSCDNPASYGATQAARSGTFAFMTQNATNTGETAFMSQIVAPAQSVGLPGRTVTFSGYAVQMDFGAGLDNDASQLMLEFLNNANAVVGSATNSASLVPGDAWVQQTVSATAPTGATKIRVTATCNNTAGGLADNYCNLAWDDFTLTADQTLPVELVAFDGRASGSAAQLSWTTASETNNLGFYVEQQTGEVWIERGFVAGRGTTTEQSDYTFAVNGLPAGRHTFRLRQVDTDGAVRDSPLVTIEIGVEGAGNVTLLGQRAVRIEANDAQPVTVAVYDMLGRAVWTDRADVSGTRDVALPDLSAGAYVVRVVGERFAQSRLIVVR